MSIGDILEDGDGITSRVQYDATGHTYRRVIFRHGIPVGAILLGTSRGMGDVHKLIAGGLQLERLRQQVVADDAMAVALMKPSAFLNLPGLAVGSGTVLLLGLGILLGSRNLRNYDPALLIYTFGALFAAFAVAYRYAVWLQRPPTRVYWRRGWQLVCQGGQLRQNLLTLLHARWQFRRPAFHTPSWCQPLDRSSLSLLGHDDGRCTDLSAGVWLAPL